jgi:2-dehydro-3-deoxyphosphogluconate aldolase/(4S)-4-hydroxy-2-oxoglutarate aldolase
MGCQDNATDDSGLNTHGGNAAGGRRRHGGEPDVTGTTAARLPVPPQIQDAGVVAIGRRLEPGTVVGIAEALARGGIGAFEITLDSDGSMAALERLAHRFGDGRELLVGAGTVLDEESARAAVRAGARFLVMPHLDELLVRVAVEEGIPVFPGAFTPTEIVAAWRAGATAVKLFPASVAGVAFVREFRGPFRDIPLLPTGGVSLETAPAFIAAGAVAVGLGSWLVAGGELGAIESRARTLVAAIATARADTMK